MMSQASSTSNPITSDEERKSAIESHLRKIRNDILDPHIHPNWGLLQWIRYWLWFPIEWSLTFAMCVLGFVLARYGWYKLNQSLSNEKQDSSVLRKQRLSKYSSNNSKSIDSMPINSMSIIIPCYNESINIQTVLLYIELNCIDKRNVEIIMVDGGSTDNWPNKVNEISHLLTIPYKIINKEGVSGRGICQNVGASESKSDILVFLHADTIVSHGFDQVAREHCKDPTLILGAWEFTVDRSIMRGPLVGIGTMQWAARVRNANWYLPYGDQGYFLHKDSFEQLGRFPDTSFAEDYELTRRARNFALKAGGRVHIDKLEAFCSPRRWEKNGVSKNTMWNQIVVYCYAHLNYSPDQIYKMYYGTEVPKNTNKTQKLERSTKTK